MAIVARIISRLLVSLRLACLLFSLSLVFCSAPAYAISTGTGSEEFPLGTDANDQFNVGTGKFVVQGASGNVGIGTTAPVAGFAVMTGNVGIGTWSPVGALEVKGTSATRIWTGAGTDTNALSAGELYVEGDLEVDGTIYGDGSGITGTIVTAGGWTDGGTNVFTTTTTDNVGIGTTTPSSTLEVVKTAAGSAPFMISSTATADGNLMIVTSGGNVGIGTTADVAGLVVMNGNVGIGTWSPVAKLQITGENAVSGLRLSTAGAVNGDFIMETTTDNNVDWIMRSNWNGSVASSNWNMRALSATGGLDIFDLNASQTRFLIDSVGNIGIGTTTPVGGLTVMNGNVGIGTWSPVSALEVKGTSATRIWTGAGTDTNALSAGELYVEGDLEVDGTIYGDGSGITGTIVSAGGWTDGGTNVYQTTTTDNVGIGTTTPATTLEIVKSSNRAPLMVSGTAAGAGDFMKIDSSGNVGIGTITPVGALTVINGNVGIGTWSPSAGVHVKAMGSILRLQRADGAAAYDVQMPNNVPGDVTDLSIIANQTNSGMLFRTSNAGGNLQDALVLNKDGNVGIGTSETRTAGMSIMNGNVGIGTWSPTQRLQVIGDVSVTDEVYGGAWDGSTNVPTKNAVYDQVQSIVAGGAGGWVDGGTNVYTATTTDSVGIGTTTPTATLLIENVGAGDSLRVNDSLFDSSPFIVSPDGNVGVGTTDPRSMLHITGSIPRIYLFDNDAALSASNPAWAVRSEDTRDGIFSVQNTTDFGNHAIRFAVQPSGNVGISTFNPPSLLSVGSASQFQVDSTGAILAVTAITTTGGYTQTGTGINTLSGNVGLGTTTPVGGLTVMTGNVGIGTWSPIGQLEVRGGSGATRIWTGAGTDNNATSAGELYVEGDLEVDGTLYGDASGLTNIPGGSSGWTDGGTNVYTSTTTDNVGVGTTTPTSTLEVVKTAAGTAPFLVSSIATADGDLLSISSAGNVGIGTNLTAAGTGLAVMNGNVGIGTWSSAATLFVKGGVVIGAGTGTFSASAQGGLGGGWNSDGNIAASGAGSIARGEVVAAAGGTANIISSAGGSVALGRVVGNGAAAAMTSSNVGSIALGYALQQTILSSGFGSFAGGYTGTGGITASGQGAFAWGDNITASGNNSFALGSGFVNSTANTFKVGYSATPTLTVTATNVGIGTIDPAGSLIVASGNVGIGTLTPVGGLTVMTGNVGIGTWSPIGQLEVRGGSGATRIWTGAGTDTNATAAGELYVEGDLEVDGTIYGDGSGITGTIAAAGGWTDGGTNVYTSTTTDNVGIGTTTPTSTLEVVKTAAGTAPLMVSSTATSDGNLLLIQSDGNVGIGTIIPVAGLSVMNGNVGIGTWSPTARLAIATGNVVVSSGNVGIGATPGSQLTILGTAGNNLSVTNSTTATLASQLVSISETGAYSTTETRSGDSFRITRTMVPTVGGALSLSGHAAFISDAFTAFEGTNTDAGNSLKILRNVSNFAPADTTVTGAVVDISDVTSLVGGTVTHMADTVKIGQTFASATGTVLNVQNAGAGLSMRINDDGTFTDATPLMVDAAGNIGIGTTTADLGKLIIQGGNVGIGTITPVGALTVMNGNVGIGTWSPTQKLQVVGDVSVTDEVYGAPWDGSTNVPTKNAVYDQVQSLVVGGAGGWVDGGTNVYNATTTDNVGIGTTTPSTTLEIVKQSAQPLLMLSSTATGDGDFLMVASDGNVGIGSINPEKTLIVHNSVPVTGITQLRIRGGAGQSTTNPYFIVEDEAGLVRHRMLKDSAQFNNVSLGALGNSFISGNNNEGQIDLQNAASDAFALTSYTNTTNANVFLMNARPSSTVENLLQVQRAGTAKITVDNAGNLGIGTTTPVGGLTVMTGNVGIGTWSPIGQLEVRGGSGATRIWTGAGTDNNATSAGELYVEGDLEVDGTLYGDASGLTNIPGGSSGWTDGGTNVYTTTTTDNVGIGTTTPNAATLEIVKNAAQPSLKISSTATGAGDYLMVTSSGAVGIGTTQTADGIGLSVMSGNVGIGTWSPTSALEIPQFSNQLKIGLIGGINFTINGLAVRYGDSTVSSALTSTQPINFGNGWIGTTGSTNTFFLINPRSTSQGPAFEVQKGGATQLIINPNGNVGIGTTTIPSAKLAVFTGNVGIGTVIPVNGTAIMNGNVGIGTWSPLGALEVKGGQGSTRIWTGAGTDTNATAAGELYVEGDLEVDGTIYGDGSGITGVIAAAGGWTDGGTNVYTTTTTDNVAIGTTTPSSTLEIVQTAAGTAPFMVSSVATGDGNLFVVKSEGNVGIGTINPQRILTIFPGGSGQGLMVTETDDASRGAVELQGGSNAGTVNVFVAGTSTIHLQGDGANYIGRTASNLQLALNDETPDAYLEVAADGTPDSALLMLSADDAGNGDYFIVSSSGNVGIGTTTPVGALTVMNGNVGIGTWSPVSPLEIFSHSSYAFRLHNAGSTGLTTQIEITNGGSTMLMGLEDVDGGNIFNETSGYSSVLGTQDARAVQFGTGNRARMTIDSVGGIGIGTTTPVGGTAIMNGNVGIGTWSPSYLAEVRGGTLAAFNSSTNTILRLQRESSAAMVFFVTGNAFNIEVGDADDHGFLFRTRNASGGTVDAMRISGSGNVGIGTTNNDAAALAVMNGNVGIGTWSPTQKLQVIGDVSVTDEAYGGTWDGSTNVPTKNAVYDQIQSLIVGGAGGWTDGGTNVYTSTTTDNVGIGTTTPTSTLEVVKTAAGTAPFMVSSTATSDGNLFLIQSDGKIGIGTTTPVGALTVMNGNVGIGTWNPTFLMDLVGNTNAMTRFKSSSVFGAMTRYENTDAGGRIYDVVSTGTGNTPGAGLYAIVDATAAIYRFVIDASGSVGIGTMTPVAGTAFMNGNVGIGTWSPIGQLEVRGGSGATRIWTGVGTDTNATAAGELYVEGDLEVDGTIYGDGTGITGAVQNGGGWVDGGANIFLATTTDNVAIGTTRPTATLLVENVAAVDSLRVNDIALDPTPFLIDQAGNVGIGTTTANGRLIIPSGNVGLGTLNPVGGLTVMTGNVGIGTWSPSGALIVAPGAGNVGFGTWSPSSVLSVYYTSSGVAPLTIGSYGNSPATLQISNTGVFTYSPPGITNGTSVNFGNNNGYSSVGDFFVINPGSAGGSNLFKIQRGGTDYVTVNNSGNLGIGTINPLSLLSTGTGNVGIGTIYAVSGTSIMNGNVGIGTWSPTGSLEVKGTGATRIWTGSGTDTNATAAGELYVQGDLEVDGTIYGDGSGITGTIVAAGGWTDGGTNVYTSTTTDNVGIGTTTPNATLVVENSSATDSLRVNDSTGGDITPFVVSSAGNVGVGTSSPAHALVVVGDIQVSNGSNGLRFGSTNGSGNGSASIYGSGLNNSADYVALDTRNIQRFKVDADGYVGIGTSTPVGGTAIMNGNVGIGTWVPGYDLTIRPSTAGGGIRITEADEPDKEAVSLFGTNGGGVVSIFSNDSVRMLLTSNNATSYFNMAGQSIGIGTNDPLGALTVMSGNVGIGTWSPIGQLEVRGGSAATRIWTGAGTDTNATAAGELYVEGDLEVDGTIYGDGSGLTSLPAGVSAGGWTDGGTNVYTSTTTDNVGIGTTTPSSTLEVVKTAAGTAPLMISSTATSDGNYFIVSSSGNVGIGTTDTLTASLSVRVGPVGIGTSKPSDGNAQFKGLHVLSSGPAADPSASAAIAIFQNSAVAGTNANIYITSGADGAANLYMGSIGSGLNSGGMEYNLGDRGGLNFVTNGNLNALYIDEDGNVGIGTINPLGLLTTGAGNVGIGTIYPVNGTAIMNGNVGIGTWSPVNRLSIKGNIGIGTTLPYLRIAAPNNGMVVEGAVGIGTWEPASGRQLHVQGSQYNKGVLIVEADNSPNNIYLYNDVGVAVGKAVTSTTYAGFTAENGVDAYFADSNLKGLFVKDGGNVGIGTETPVGGLVVMNGNVGIGTWSPIYRLQVIGTLDATTITQGGVPIGGASGWTDGGTNVYTTTTTDNVGIGTTTPNAATLEIVKNAAQAPLKISGSATGAGDFFLMDSAGNIGIGTTVFGAGTGLAIMNGNVGIGTWNPIYEFQVLGSIAVGNSTGTIFGDDNLIRPGATSSFVNIKGGSGAAKMTIGNSILAFAAGNSVGDYIGFHTNASSSTSAGLERMRISVGGNVAIGTTTPVGALVVMNGNVGIGTFSPIGQLEVRGGSGPVWISNNGGTNTNATGAGELYVQGDLEVDGTLYGDGSGLTALPAGVAAGGWTDGGTNVYTSTTTDNVGIGTTTPSTTLEIVLQGTNSPLMVSSVASGDGDHLVVRSSGNVGLGTVAPNARLDLMPASGGSAIRVTELDTNANTTFLVTGANSSGTMSIYADGAPNITLNGNSNGTFNILKYDVDFIFHGDTADDLIRTDASTDSASMGGGAFYVSALTKNVGIGTNIPSGALAVMSGNVGIGTWSPRRNLHVVDSSNSGQTVMIERGGLSYGMGLSGLISGDATDFLIAPNQAGSGFSFNAINDSSATLTALTINKNGNVGMGTTTPVGGLAVMSGNVGIGTWVPESSLSVNGDIRLQTGGTLWFGPSGAPTRITGTGANILFQFASGPSVAIQAGSANVGIGTTSLTGGLVVMTGNVGFGTWSPRAQLEIGTGGTINNLSGLDDIYVKDDIEVDGSIFLADGTELNDASDLGGSSGWTDGGTNIYTTTTTDNVGIGTTTPSTTIEIVQQTSRAPWMISTVPTGDGDLMVMTSNGNVGIGTRSPQAKMHVGDGDIMLDDERQVFFGASHGIRDNGIDLNSYSYANIRFYADNDNGEIGTEGIQFFAGVAEGTSTGAIMALYNGGNVGIGTMTPVNGTAIMNGNVGIGTWNPTKMFQVGTGSAAGIDNQGWVYASNRYYFTNGNETLSYTGGDLQLGTNSAGWTSLSLGNSNTVRMYINSAGNVGIGTINPKSRLAVNGGVGIGTLSGSSFINTAAPSGGLIVENNVGIGTTTPVGGLVVMNGNVGIGTWSPIYRLQVIGALDATTITQGGVPIGGASGWTDGGTNVYTTTTTDNVGIGTTTPSTTFEIVQQGTNVPLMISSVPTANGDYLFVKSDGNVGIGTINPEAGLHVADTDNTHDNYIMVSSQDRDAGLVMSEDNSFSTLQAAVNYSGAFNRLDIATSAAASGVGAVNLLTERISIDAVSGNIGMGTITPVGGLVVMNGNVGIGTWNPKNRFEVKNLVFFDHVAENTFLGQANGNTITTGNANTAVGDEAMDAATTASGNSAFGPDALGIMQTGSGNSAFGSAALSAIDGGTSNTALGYSSLDAWTAGLDNTAVGANSLGAAGSSSQNTAVGANALLLATGGNNTALGYQVADNLTTGTNNIIIGMDIDAPFLTGNNQMSIGNLIYGTGIDGSGLTISTGNIGIATFSPQSRFEVIGDTRVGIGTFNNASSSADLYVQGNLEVDGTIIGSVSAAGGWTDGGTNVYTTTTTDNVGIGTTTPTSTLEVVKTAAGTAPLMVSSTATRDGDQFIVSSAGNVGIGTTVFASGTGLTVMNGNVGIGTWSPDSAFQVQHLVYFHHVNENVFIGGRQGNTPYNGTQLTAVGDDALINNTSGTENSAFGEDSLFNNAAGTSNTAIGANTLFQNDDGSWNTAVGYSALSTNASGTDNTAVGFTALTITTGSNNIALGSKAGDALTSGSNNLIIGYDVDAPSNTGSNQMTLGNLIFGTGVDGSGTTVSTGNIGIGTFSPQSKFEVIGDTRVGIGTFNNASSSADLYVQGNLEVDGTIFGSVSAAGGWTDGGTNVYTSLTTDNVGIGTTTPTSTLEVVKTAAGTAPFMVSSTATRDGDQFIITSAGNVGIGTTVFASGTGLAVMNGSVGIGTWNPGAIDFVIKTAGSGGDVLTIWDSSANSIYNFSRGGTLTGGQLQFWGATLAPGGSGGLEPLVIVGTDDQSVDLQQWTRTGLGTLGVVNRIGYVGIGTVNPLNRLVVNGGVGIGTLFSSSFINTLAPAGGLIVENNVGIGTVTPVGGLVVMNGNVGIGTWSPVAKLEVKGAIQMTGSGDSYFNGNLGIGNAAPTQALDVTGTARMSGFQLTTGPSVGYVLTSDGAGTGTWQTNSGGISGLNTGFLTKAASATTIDDSVLYQTSGRIGLGTTTPVGAFNVMTGNVGIGTWSPTGALEVKGPASGQITINGPSGGCLMFRDTDNAGWTECNALNGVLTCSLDADGICDGS